MVDLNSAPLDTPDGVFLHYPLEVGYGPCSISLLDISGLQAHAAALGAGEATG